MKLSCENNHIWSRFHAAINESATAAPRLQRRTCQSRGICDSLVNETLGEAQIRPLTDEVIGKTRLCWEYQHVGDFKNMSTFMASLEITGAVIRPDDAGYDEARTAWNLTVHHRPALIVVAKNTQDVVSAVQFAANEGLSVAVQSTGHGTIRQADQDALLILTSGLNQLQVDAERQTAWVGAGLKWGEVVTAAQLHGLTPLFGASPIVGAVGYTVGGGVGWFGRKFGLAVDSVIRFEVVISNGEIINASATENSDLFWAICGGGGAFGVITRMEIKLYPVTQVYGGNLLYPVEAAKDVYRFYREWIKTLPDEFTTSIVLMNFPNFQSVPEFLRGTTGVMIRGAYVGSVQEGAAYIQQWLDWRVPTANMFQPMPVSEMHTISNDPVDPVPSMTTGAYLRELSDAAIDSIIRYGVQRNGSAPLIFVEVRHMGGAISRIDSNANAFSHRDQSLNLYMVGMTPIPDTMTLFKHYTRQFKRDLTSALSGGAYLNFLEGAEARGRVREGYTPEKFERLKAIKAKYDPDNRFGYSYNIPVN